LVNPSSSRQAPGRASERHLCGALGIDLVELRVGHILIKVGAPKGIMPTAKYAGQETVAFQTFP
jgi:hypothetical protein